MIGNIAQSIESLYSMQEILNPISNPPKMLMWSVKSFCRESFRDESLAPHFLSVALAQFAPREMTATKGDSSDGATMTWTRKEVYQKSFLLLLYPHTRWHILMNGADYCDYRQVSWATGYCGLPSCEIRPHIDNCPVYTCPHTPVCWSTMVEGLGNTEEVQVQTNNMYKPDASNIHLYDGFSLWTPTPTAVACGNEKVKTNGN